MTEATQHYLDPTGRPAPEPTGGAICAMVAAVGGEPVACGLPAGHRAPHGFADVPGAPRGSRPPGRSGSDRTGAATAAGRAPGGLTARQGSAADMCAAPSKDGTLACAHSPAHKGKCSWSKAKAA